MSKYSIDHFLKCCEATGPVRLAVDREGDQTETSYIFQQPFALIGNHERATARLVHPQVSTRQLYLQVLGGKMYAVQLSPRIPVRWAGEKRTSGWVSTTDTMTFGPYSVRVTGGITPTGSPPPRNPLRHSSSDGPAVTLELLRGDEPPAFGVLDRDLSLIGSAGLCRVRLRDPRISSVHCSLVRTGDGYWVVDLGGRGGVRVNDVVVTVAFLEDGDLIGLDGTSIRVQYDRSPTGKVATALQSNGEKLFADQIDSLEQQDTGMRPAGLSDEASLGPILDRFAEFQNQTFEQFQGVLRSMAQTFASMLNEQRAFVRDELDRLERLTQSKEGALPTNGFPPLANVQSDTLAEAATEPPEVEMVPPPEPLSQNQVPDSQFHLWFEEQLNTLRDRRTSTWQRLFGSQSGGVAGGSRPGG